MGTIREEVQFRGDTKHYDAAVKRITASGKKLEKSFAGTALKVAGVAAAFEVARRAMTAPIKLFAQYQAHVVGLEKVLKGNADQQKRVVDQVTSLSRSMPVATNELLRMAAAGAQMGVADANVRDFTESMTKLQATTDITEELALSFGRLQKFTGTGFKELSSIMVALGNNMAATESEILTLAVQVTGRFGALKQELEFTGDELVAISGHMAAANVQAQAGSTTFRKWGQSLAEALSGNADKMKALKEITGLTEKQIREMGSAKVWQEFLRGVKRAGSDSQEFLQELEIGGSISVGVINQLTGTVDDLTTAFSLANEEARNGGEAIEGEYSKSVETLASKWEILGNNVELVAINLTNKLAPAMNTILDIMNRMTGATDDKFLQEQNDAIRERIGQLAEQRRLQGKLSGIDQQEYETLHAQLFSNLRELSPTEAGGGGADAMKNRKRNKGGATPASASPESQSPKKKAAAGVDPSGDYGHFGDESERAGTDQVEAQRERARTLKEQRMREDNEHLRGIQEQMDAEAAALEEAKFQEELRLSTDREMQKWNAKQLAEDNAVKIRERKRKEQLKREAKGQQLADNLFVNLAATRNDKLAKIGQLGMIWKQAVATADAIKAGAGLPFPANLAAIASGVAAVVANFGALKFAEGGIVPGGAPHTDRIPATLTPGEVVLNKEQQRALLNGGGNIDYDRLAAAVAGAFDGKEIIATLGDKRDVVNDIRSELAGAGASGI